MIRLQVFDANIGRLYGFIFLLVGRQAIKIPLNHAADVTCVFRHRGRNTLYELHG